MEAQRKQIIENYVMSYNNFDIDGMTADLARHVVFENISQGKVDLRTEGIESFRKQAALGRQYFRQRKQTISGWQVGDDVITVDIDYEAVLNIDLPNGLTSGDTLRLKGRSVFVFQDTKIVKITDES
ncbi:MAG: hypothetical protein OHK0039_06440 [Bacteroidia bacterium]